MVLTSVASNKEYAGEGVTSVLEQKQTLVLIPMLLMARILIVPAPRGKRAVSQ